MKRFSFLFMGLVFLGVFSLVAFADSGKDDAWGNVPSVAAVDPGRHSYGEISDESYSLQEIIDAGHGFFGETTGGFTRVVRHLFEEQGAPSAYIIGEEVAGAFLGGLRIGEGEIFLKSGARYKIYWQGPSLGFDIGANGSRTMTLVYHIDNVGDVYGRHTGVEGSLYVVGGFGVNYQRGERVVLAPIRTGIGARAGVNIGYLKYTPEPSWNPF